MSISSSEGSPLLLDVSAKYQKLAAEYAKVRANVAVLKKAVVDEQTRSTELKEIIKTRDQTLRKHDQELESLTFRNQQLTKRVLFLQEELDRIQEVSKKGRPRQETSVAAEESKLFQEELQTRIIENAKLLSLLDEKEQELENERRQWQNSQAKYESQLMEAQTSLADMQACSKPKSKVNDTRQNEKLQWIVIKDLPFSSLCEPLNVLIESENGHVVPDLENVIRATSEQLVSHALHDYLKQLAVVINRTEKRNDMVHEFLITVKKLVDEVIRYLDSDVPYSVLSISSAVDYLCCVAIKYKTAGIPIRAQIALDNLESNCECFQRVLNESVSSKQCQLKNLSCEQKLESVERNISKPKPSANGPIKEISTARELPPKTISNEFGDGTIIAEPAWKETSVREHISIMTNSLITDRQSAESKVTSVLNECEALKSRLAHYCEESSKSKETVQNLQEELSVTSRNYEEQLSSMSEHMANMNDRLAAQEAMIEELTFELTKKDSKKSRSK